MSILTFGMIMLHFVHTLPSVACQHNGIYNVVGAECTRTKADECSDKAATW